MTRTYRTLLLGLSSLLLAGTACSPAIAKANNVTVTGPARFDPNLPHFLVTYSDLDLAQAAGEKTLMVRVRGAVQIVCNGQDQMGVAREYRDCKRSASAGAEPQVTAAVRRAREIATTGFSAIPVAAITIIAP